MPERQIFDLNPCVVSIATLPSHVFAGDRAKEAFKKYPRDTFGSTYHFTLAKRTPVGYQIIAITEPAEGNVIAELDHQIKRQAMYDDIVGYESTVEIFNKIQSHR